MRDGIRAEPVVDDARVDGAEVDAVRDVAAVVLERGIARERIEIRRRAVQAAVDAAADRHHQAGRAVVGALAAVLA